MTLITCDTIIEWLHEKIENKEPVAPDVFLDAAMKLTILVGDEQALLFDTQQNIAGGKVKFIEEGNSVAMAKVKIEATDLYNLMKKREAKIERIFEFIRISKIQARMSQNEWQSQR